MFAKSIFDKWVTSFLTENPTGIFVEIGCGLNTRFERVDNGKVYWFDLDLPDSIAVRKHFFSETDRCKLIAASVLDPSWINTVKSAGDAPIMFVAEGLLIYLTEAEVKQVFALLVENFPGALLAFDSMSPYLIKNQKQYGVLKKFAAKFQWGIEDIQTIQSWDNRYQVLEALQMPMVASQYTHRLGLINSLMFKFSPFKNMYSFSLAQLG